jgi:hypothetical protein
MEMNTPCPARESSASPAKGEFSDIQKERKDAGTVFISRCRAPAAGFQRFLT